MVTPRCYPKSLLLYYIILHHTKRKSKWVITPNQKPLVMLATLALASFTSWFHSSTGHSCLQNMNAFCIIVNITLLVSTAHLSPSLLAPTLPPSHSPSLPPQPACNMYNLKHGQQPTLQPAQPVCNMYKMPNLRIPYNLQPAQPDFRWHFLPT